MRSWLLTGAVPLLLLAACTSSPGAATNSPSPSPASIPSPSPSPSPSPRPTRAPSPSPVPNPFLYVQIVSADYGEIVVQTVAGATCNAQVFMPNGQDAGGLRNPQVANAGGTAGWTYPTPGGQIGTGTATVTCTHNGLSGSSSSYYPVGT